MVALFLTDSKFLGSWKWKIVAARNDRMRVSECVREGGREGEEKKGVGRLSMF